MAKAFPLKLTIDIVFYDEVRRRQINNIVLCCRDSRRGPILIKIKNFRGESRTNYTFIDPIITDIEPRHGPQSGGTKIRIKGEYLNAGSHVEAYIGNYSCRIIKTKKKVKFCFELFLYLILNLSFYTPLFPFFSPLFAFLPIFSVSILLISLNPIYFYFFFL